MIQRTLVTPAARAATRADAPHQERMILIGLAAALLLTGAAALVRAGRFVRRGGILSWHEARLVRGMVEIPGESPLALAPTVAVTMTGSTVLVAPSFVVPTATYRELPAIDRRSIFFGPRSEASGRARRMTGIALAAFVASILTAAVGLLAYR